MHNLDPTLKKRAAAIRLVAMDVDGVLTDGHLYYGDAGEQLKVFHVHDGMGLRRLLDAGIDIAIISARKSQAVERRMTELGVGNVLLGCKDKGAAIDRLMQESALHGPALAAIGDDLPDLPMLRRAGLAVAVADAQPAVLEAAHWVTGRRGGRGAVRELCELILNVQKK